MSDEPDLLRFTRAERLVHRSVAVLVGVCVLTAAVLYLEPLATLVGHRPVVTFLHVWAGVALVVPLLGGLASKAYRADLGRLNRMDTRDRLWLADRAVRARNREVGKFNAGQKLNTTLSGASLLVLLGTGSIMAWTWPAPVAQRTGATFVHDVTALLFGLLVAGHAWQAQNDPEARYGMRTGRVGPAWARRHHPAWAADPDD
ncbi:cytochrome b/b6 domain-containing protein [Rhodococcus aerolatus]